VGRVGGDSNTYYSTVCLCLNNFYANLKPDTVVLCTMAKIGYIPVALLDIRCVYVIIKLIQRQSLEIQSLKRVSQLIDIKFLPLLGRRLRINLLRFSCSNINKKNFRSVWGHQTHGCGRLQKN
jgi:hypothetical protein